MMELSKHPEDIDFQKYWQILRRHRIPSTTVFLITVVLATTFALLSEKKYAAYGKLKFTKENTTSALIAESAEKLGKLETLSSTATPVDTEAEVIQSAPVIKKVIQQVNLVTKNGELIDYEDFLENLDVYNVPGTDVLGINYKSADKEEAQTIVNTLIEVYLDKNVAINRQQAQAAREFITQQLPKTEAELQVAEIQLKAFKEQNNIVNLDVETELAANKIGVIDEQIDSVEVNLEKVNSQIDEIKQKLNISSEEAIALNTINDSPAVQQVLTKLKNVEDSLAIERSRFRANSPIVIDLQEKKAELEKELQTRTQQSLNLEDLTSRKIFQTGDIQKQLAQDLVNYEVQSQSLSKELKSLQALKATSRQRNNSIPQIQQQYQTLLRKTEVSQSAYKSLLNSLQQTQIAENQNVGNAQVISQAVLTKYPVSTSRKLIVAGGIGVGSILYLITAFLLELRDPSFKTSKELRKFFDYKLLTSIPDLEQKGLFGRNQPLAILPEHQTTEAPYSWVSQAYNMLYTNLQFIATDKDIQVITITSSIPKEGKSTVSANLASSISQLGQKVLLIDGDFHKPKQHLVWGLNNSLGIIEVLQGKVDLSQAVKSLPNNTFLDVLPAGLNKTEYLSLLKSEKMNQLISLCREKYDLIIIDTPPVSLFPETLTISKNTDGIVLVGRLGVTDPKIAKNAQELFELSEQRILGLVINSVDNEAEIQYKYAGYYEQNFEPQQNLLSSSHNR